MLIQRVFFRFGRLDRIFVVYINEIHEILKSSTQQPRFISTTDRLAKNSDDEDENERPAGK